MVAADPNVNTTPPLSLRARVLAMARERFARDGVEATSLAEVALAAHMSEADLKYYFRTKTELLMAIFDEGWAPIVARLTEVAEESNTGYEAVIYMFTVVLQLMEKDRAFARLLLFEGHRIDPDTHQVRVSKGYRRFLDLCLEVAKRGQQDGSFKTAIQPQVIVSALLGTVLGLLRDKALSEGEAPPSPFSIPQLLAVFATVTASFSPVSSRRNAKTLA